VTTNWINQPLPTFASTNTSQKLYATDMDVAEYLPLYLAGRLPSWTREYGAAWVAPDGTLVATTWHTCLTDRLTHYKRYGYLPAMERGYFRLALEQDRGYLGSGIVRVTNITVSGTMEFTPAQVTTLRTMAAEFECGLTVEGEASGARNSFPNSRAFGQWAAGVVDAPVAQVRATLDADPGSYAYHVRMRGFRKAIAAEKLPWAERVARTPDTRFIQALTEVLASMAPPVGSSTRIARRPGNPAVMAMFDPRWNAEGTRRRGTRRINPNW
jgi:hypothetical protein